MLNELMTKDEAHAVLAPHLPSLRVFVEQGWGEWHQLIATSPFMVESRLVSRANVVYDRISKAAEKYFDELDIPTSWKNQCLTVSLDDGRIILRFKKFQNRKLRTSGIPTQQRLEFEMQQVVLDGTASTYVVVGYLPDELGMGLDVIALACSYNGTLLWQIDLDQDEIGDVVPVRTDAPAGPPVRSSRPAASKEREEGH
jgi:hypothetical protein